ncbi:proline-rich basic protein 1 [Dromaius novaehollandiae]|uniref:proline-rich basic protein 1 n=1 Tax=Dromaius novaehollandiae TaxID=8790 RepID=UPI00311EA32E
MISCGKSKPGPLCCTGQAAEPPSCDSKGLCGTCERPCSVTEEDSQLLGLSRDDLPKSMSDSSVSSYHSALCSEGTETFRDCLEFLEEEREDRWAPGDPAASPAGTPGSGDGSRPREEKTQQVQLSVTAKNSTAAGHGGRMGPGRGERQPAASEYSDQPSPFSAEAPGVMFCNAHKARKSGRAPGAGKVACAQRGTLSDSDEADNEVQKLTARSFRSLSGPHGSYLDMFSSHTSSSLSNSLSEDSGAMKRWPTCGEPQGELLSSLPGKEQFECVDVELESSDAKKGHCKKRTVPKRQIQLKRKERKEAGFFPWGDCSAHQPLPPPRKEPLVKGRAISDEFRINYKQFMKTASLDDAYSKTRMASCLVKNVLAKKMQYEQRIKMEQSALRGSSTSSGPSSVGTDLAGDGLEGKSSSLSKSDCSYSAEDVLGHPGGERPATTRPAKGVVLDEQTRESVCKLKTTFNELNERMRYQEVMQCQWLPAVVAGPTEELPGGGREPTAERQDYRRARALFEAQQGTRKALDAAPKFQKPQKPWPSLKQRAIRLSKPKMIPFEPKGLGIPEAAPRSVFTTRTQEVKLVPQSWREEKLPAGGSEGCPTVDGAPQGALPVPHRPPPTCSPEGSPQPGNKGKGQIPQPRDVRKLVKNTYSLCFKPAGTPAPTPQGRSASGPSPSAAEPTSASPLFIHCTSVCRREPVPAMSRARKKSPQQPEDGDVLTVPGREPAEARADGPAKPPESQRSVARDSPMHITKIQSTRRIAGGQEGLPGRGGAPPARRERSELTLPPVARAAPHLESHLHVQVSPPSERALGPPAGASPAPWGAAPRQDDASAQAAPSSIASSTVLLTEKTILFPPPASATEEAEGHHDGATSAKGPNPLLQQLLSSEGGFGPPGASPGASGVSELGPPPGGSTHLQPMKPAAISAPKPFTKEHLVSSMGPREAEREKPDVVKQLGSWVVSAGTSVSPDSVSPTATFRAREVSEEAGVPKGPSVTPAPLVGRLPERRENWEHLTKQPGANEQYFTATPVENTNYLTIPVKAPKSTPAPKLPSVPNLASASFGTPLVPSRAGTSFGHPSASNLASTSFGNPLVASPASTSFGTPLGSHPAGTSFGHPSASKLASASFGSPLVPNPPSTSLGSLLVPKPSSMSFGTPLVPNPSSTSFGSPLVTNPVPTSLGHPSVSNPVSSSFRSPLVPNPATASFGSPLVSSPASPPSVGGASLPPGGEAPGSKPSPEPQAPEGQATAEQPGAQPQPRLDDAPHFPRRTDGASTSSKSTPSPTRAFAPHLSTHRKMLVDPDSGKCYYMEPPRQPQLKTLYDPETGQYLEVLIPPVPLAAHAGLYQASFNPLLMTPGVYGPPYVPYAGFPGLPAPLSPAATSPAHPDLQSQPLLAENTAFPAAFSPAPKGEGPPAAAGPDCGYLDSLYYIPTGMRASPGPGQPSASGSPAGPEKGPLLRM